MVAPRMTRPVLTASLPSQTIATTGPVESGWRVSEEWACVGAGCRRCGSPGSHLGRGSRGPGNQPVDPSQMQHPERMRREPNRMSRLARSRPPAEPPQRQRSTPATPKHPASEQQGDWEGSLPEAMYLTRPGKNFFSLRSACAHRRGRASASPADSHSGTRSCVRSGSR